ncbi:glutathione S-transferase [Aspergillus similis]
MQPIKLYSHPIRPNPWKKEPYINLCPNCRLPAVVDPNKGITLWESGAIVNYLRHQLQQWLHFQVSGQRQPEPVLLAIKRYTEEIRRVMGVLERGLDGKEWLVGDNCTYADLCFVPWQELVPFIVRDEKIVQELMEQHPNTRAWIDRMKARPEVRKVLEEKSKAMQQV